MQYKELIDARTKKRITQAELADKIGVGRALISKYENGMIDPTITQIRKIAAALEVPVTQLLPLDADYIKDETDKDEHFLKTMLPALRPSEELSEKLEAIKVLMHASGYDLMKVDGTFGLTGPKGSYQISTEEIEHFESQIIDFIEFQCQQIE